MNMNVFRSLWMIIFCIVVSPADGEILQNNIVGYECKGVSKGNNRVEVNFDAINEPFSTMNMVLQFNPAEGVIGDDLAFELDGRLQRYRFDSYDGKNYVLTEVGLDHRNEVTLDAIPLMKFFWLYHRSKTNVIVTCVGEIDSDVKRRIGQETTRKCRNLKEITITQVGDDDKVALLKLEGGKIKKVEE